MLILVEAVTSAVCRLPFLKQLGSVSNSTELVLLGHVSSLVLR